MAICYLCHLVFYYYTISYIISSIGKNHKYQQGKL